MNNQTQTIELLKLLGDDTAEAVLAHLDPGKASELRASLSAEESLDLDRDDRRALLDQFGRFMEFAGASATYRADGAGPSLYAEPDDGRSQADYNVADVQGNGTSQTGGSSDASGTAGPIASSDGSGNPTAVDSDSNAEVSPQLTGDPLHDLMLLNLFQVAGALETEQPRTVAILISELSFQQSADVLSLLPADHQAAVVKEMAHELAAPPILIDRIARATLQRALTLPAAEPDRRDRLDRLSDVLRAVPRKLRRNMMTGIEEEDQEMSQALLKKLYRFEDLTSLDSRAIQRILGEIDGTTLTTAMFGAATEIVDTVLGNLSKRARQSIEEELSFQSAVPEARVEAAREAVAEVIARIDQENE